MENKTSKYFKYATGEIFLVVIGILIALQINNWNEKRKINLKSLNYLKRLKVDLDSVSKDIENSLNWTERRFNEATLVLDVLDSKNLPNSKIKDFEVYLKQYFKFQITSQNTIAYQEMLSSGDLGLIKNEWLRNEFANLSENRDFIMEVNQTNHASYKSNMEIMQRHIRYQINTTRKDFTEIKVKYDFNKMVKDTVFINQISNQAYTWYDILRMYKTHLKQVNVIKDSIKVELKLYD